MRIISSKVIGIVVVLGIAGSAHAQFSTPQHELGITAGTLVYLGDLTPERYGSWKSPGIAVNLFYNRILSRSFSLRTNLAIGRTNADDANYAHPAYRQQRAFRFKARVTELSELLVWNVTGNNYGEHKLSPYLFAGVGISFLNIRRDWSRFNPESFAGDSAMLAGLNEDTLHSLPRTAAALPVGGGLRYNINSRFSIIAEASYRVMFTDYLDGFSKAANPDKNDNYSNYAIGVIYTLGGGRDGGGSGRGRGSMKCPPIP